MGISGFQVESKNRKGVPKVSPKSQKDFAQEIGFNQSSISHIESRSTKHPSRGLIMAILATYPQVNETWLKTGQGNMFKDVALSEGVKESAIEYTELGCSLNINLKWMHSLR
ncbi:MAG: hypothetical protein C0392_15450 [Syntrophus sp. (in: bacteria)]|nr:hypothetical protein [Syntrophus sp. (in: bacteria)]